MHHNYSTGLVGMWELLHLPDIGISASVGRPLAPSALGRNCVGRIGCLGFAVVPDQRRCRRFDAEPGAGNTHTLPMLPRATNPGNGCTGTAYLLNQKAGRRQ